jgi:hypothetical protein
VAGYKHLIALAGDAHHMVALGKVEGLLITLRDNLSDRFLATSIKELTSLLNNLPTPQLACVVAILLAGQPGVSDPSGERLQITTSFTSKLASLLSGKDLPPEAFEYIGRLKLDANKISFAAKAEIAWNIAYLLGYKSIY